MEGGPTCEGLETEATLASQDSDGVFVRDVGIGASVGVGVWMDEVDRIRLVPGSAPDSESCCSLSSRG
jgi:hypothetical protein